jgi:hypothetical protein
MAEVLIGTNSPISHQVFWQGEVVDSDSVPTVKVYDITEDPSIVPSISPTTILTTLTSVKDETNIGLYNVYIPLNITTRNRVLKLEWNYSVNSSLVSKTHDVSVVTPYTDLSQMYQELGISSDPSDPSYRSYKELKAAENYARRKIEDYTGQSFYLYDDVELVYGSGSDVLPTQQKINNIYKLYVNDVLLYDSLNSINNWGLSLEVSETGYGIKVNRANLLDNSTYIANGMVPPSFNDYGTGAFRTNVKYKVIGKFGWNKVPTQVDLACIELIKDFFSNDKEWRNRYLKTIQTFDWNFEFDSQAYTGTGNAYADQLLSEYVLTQSVII